MEEQAEGQGQDVQELERIVVSSSIVPAYLINLLKAVLLIGGLIGAYFLVLYILGENPFEGVLDLVNIPFVWVTRGVMGILAVVFVVIILNTLALTSYELVFEGDTLKYSYGSFFKVTRSTDIANIIRVNFKEYVPSKLGDIVVEFTGTEEKSLKVQYVSNAAEQAGLINRLVSLKKSQLMTAIDEMGS